VSGTVEDPHPGPLLRAGEGVAGAALGVDATRSALHPVLHGKDGAPPGPLAELWRDFRRNRGAIVGLVVVALLVLAALFADVIAPHPPNEQYRDATLKAPSLQPIGGHVFLLGTDPVGRDVLSRLIHGTRLSLAIGLVSVGLSLTGGVLLGLVAGFFRGGVEFTVMRLMDIMLALPSLLLAVAVVAILGPGLANAMYAIAIVMLPHFVRLTRAAVIGELAKDYVNASRIAGAGTARLMFDTVLPNCAAPLIVQGTLGFSTAILDAAALGFLGLGAQPPTPEWGSMLASALEFIQSAWWVVTLPGLAILISVLAFNLMGDGLRDALDPRLKR
jgi:dipeptide transport system permease protein